jgi:hypothetical protein
VRRAARRIAPTPVEGGLLGLLREVFPGRFD